MQDYMAIECGLPNAMEVRMMQDFLTKNGEHYMVPVSIPHSMENVQYLLENVRKRCGKRTVICQICVAGQR